MAWVDAVDGAASWLAARATNGTVTSQAGIFEGLNPSKWNSADPIILFIIQATIVVSLTRALYWPLSKIREPKVIAEVITVGLSTSLTVPSPLKSIHAAVS